MIRGMMTTAEVAAELGITTSRVRQLARSRKLGTLVSDRLRLYSAKDVERMRVRTVGRPRSAPPEPGGQP